MQQAMAHRAPIRAGTSPGTPVHGRCTNRLRSQRAGPLRRREVRVTVPNAPCDQLCPQSETQTQPTPSISRSAWSGFRLSGLCLPCPSAGWKTLPQSVKGTKPMNTRFSPDGQTPSEDPDRPDLLRRLSIIEQNQRDILFLLRSLRLALHNVRVELSPETRRIHREILRLEPYNGLCPCCLQTRVVSDEGELIPPVEFDHFWGAVYNAPVHSWLICRACHQELNNDPHLTWYHRLRTRFRRYQAAAEAYTMAFGQRTPARMHASKRRLVP